MRRFTARSGWVLRKSSPPATSRAFLPASRSQHRMWKWSSPPPSPAPWPSSSRPVNSTSPCSNKALSPATGPRRKSARAAVLGYVGHTQPAHAGGASRHGLAVGLPVAAALARRMPVARNGVAQPGTERAQHRIASTSGTTSGQLALARGGLAVVATLKSLDLPEGLRHVRGDEGLPELPEVALLMLKAREPRQPATDLLADCIRKVVSTDEIQTGTPTGD